jgi:flagellar biosynthesis/type III secretory pathway chaperone
MRRREPSERLERHMERGEELMELNRTAFDRNMAAFDRNTQAFERVMAALDRHEQKVAEQATFIRDVNRRNEVVMQQIVRDQQQFMKGLSVRDEKADRERAKADRKTGRILVELKDLREESIAQRQALLAMIDRLPPAEAA